MGEGVPPFDFVTQQNKGMCMLKDMQGILLLRIYSPTAE